MIFMLIDEMYLVDLIALNSKLKHLEVQQAEATASEQSDHRKQILLTNIFISKAKTAYSHITKKSMQEVSSLSIDFLFSWYTDFINSFELSLYGKWWLDVKLPEPELTHMVPITFGQFIDAKMMVDGGAKNGQDKWQVVQYLIAIFCIGVKKKYDYNYTNELNPQFIRSGKVSVRKAIIVSIWWDHLNRYINDNYTVFQDSGDVRENSGNMDEHMQRWGWVNFLKGIAKTKAFDINGSGWNSIDCVRETKASEILVWASEEKDQNIATNRDMKEAYRHH